MAGQGIDVRSVRGVEIQARKRCAEVVQGIGDEGIRSFSSTS
jgi:hypothetical protein